MCRVGVGVGGGGGASSVCLQHRDVGSELHGCGQAHLCRTRVRHLSCNEGQVLGKQQQLR